MSLASGRAKLQGAYKDLLVEWERISDRWDDAASRDIEKRYLEPIKPKLKSAGKAIDQMGQHLIHARQECE